MRICYFENKCVLSGTIEVLLTKKKKIIKEKILKNTFLEIFAPLDVVTVVV